jgi:hypothetical protein
LLKTANVSYFSTQLLSSLERVGLTRAQLALEAGIDYHILIKVALDRRQADPKTVSALCRALPREEAAALVVARLRDELPPDCVDLVLLEPSAMVVEEPQAAYGEIKMPDELRAAIAKLSRAAVLTKEWKDLLTDLAKIC